MNEIHSRVLVLGLEDVLRDRWPEGEDIPLWDGRTGDRIAEILLSGDMGF